MLRFETKKFFVWTILAVVLIFYTSASADLSSSGFKVEDPVIDSGLSSSTSSNFGLGQSVSQPAVGKSTSSGFQLWSGFQYFYKINANTLTPTAGNAQVALSWTVPQTFLGITISSYEVGTGTVSGSYVFEDVGNVTSFTKTGLTNGTQYFFKIKTKGPGGAFLVFSNEATATPTGGATPPPPPPPSGGGGGGGGGSPVGGASLLVSGLAYPGRQVTVLKDGTVAAVTTADPAAQFNVTISGLYAGAHNFSVYVTDENGKRSPVESFYQLFSDGVTSRFENLFLGPTAGVSHSIIKRGDTLSIFGYTVPSSEVTIYVNSTTEFADKVKSESNGSYFEAFNTKVLDLGGHSTKSQAATGNKLSSYSNAADFLVSDKSVELPKTGSLAGDASGDGRVNLTDFSVLLFYWQQPSPPVFADIDKSGTVDLVDFSILLYYWTG
ncbi:MAG TPA: Ig-like domain-containing protein [Patescibacteria group bacterium]|jgi:hypothetical protein|nr:Ig-like domain-containing protein [Patescibacteria group bacterium]